MGNECQQVNHMAKPSALERIQNSKGEGTLYSSKLKEEMKENYSGPWYSGTVKNKRPNGHGTLEWDNGASYIGTF